MPSSAHGLQIDTGRPRGYDPFPRVGLERVTLPDGQFQTEALIKVKNNSEGF